jgi:oligopeptide transport system ATP-binding protein
MTLLRVRDLGVDIGSGRGVVRAVDGVDFDLAAGGSLGIVGESGSGKTQTALAIVGLLPANARCRGSVRFNGTELLRLRPRVRRQLRGAHIGLVFQDPMTSLNPYLTIGTQMAEVIERHQRLPRKEARHQAAQMLERVQIAAAGAALDRYPHEFSGGMRQRITIAMMLSCRPQLLIADEPTSALDATVQAQILALLAELRREMGLALILISHDIDVIGQMCDEILVLYGGRPMESGPTSQVLARPAHPYTRALLASRLSFDQPRAGSLPAIPGQPPEPSLRLDGCPFHPRCGEAFVTCRRARPPLRETAAGGLSACYLEER